LFAPRNQSKRWGNNYLAVFEESRTRGKYVNRWIARSHALSLEEKSDKNSRPKPWYGGSTTKPGKPINGGWSSDLTNAD
jgi:hypothetical protein